jgi:hypothetical protein
MPLQQALPTWGPLNNVNNGSQSGQTDPLTNFPYAGGGLNLGDYFDLTEQEANQLSYTTNGILHAGRYRYVQVASSATTANVKVGTVGYIQPGTFVQNIVQLAAGSGMTVGATATGTTAAGGGTTQATFQVVVLTATTVAITMLTPGVGFTSLPTATITGTGGTPPTLTVEMGFTVNQVTSADIAASSGTMARPIVFLNSITPGNYGFVQELGVATVLATASTIQAVHNYALATPSGSTPIGLLVASATTITPFCIGTVLDPIGSSTAITPFKVLLGYSCGVVQD